MRMIFLILNYMRETRGKLVQNKVFCVYKIEVGDKKFENKFFCINDHAIVDTKSYIRHLKKTALFSLDQIYVKISKTNLEIMEKAPNSDL